MAPKRRQIVAYAAVLATGLASLATSPCESSTAVETPPLTVELGGSGAEVREGFRVRTNSGFDRVEVTARLIAGEGSAEVEVPEVWLGPPEGDGSVSDAGMAPPFTVDDMGATAVVCDGVCARDFEVIVRRVSGTDPAELELSVRISATSQSCEEGGDHYFVVEHTP
jgi:hypothetical protein